MNKNENTTKFRDCRFHAIAVLGVTAPALSATTISILAAAIVTYHLWPLELVNTVTWPLITAWGLAAVAGLFMLKWLCFARELYGAKDLNAAVVLFAYGIITGILAIYYVPDWLGATSIWGIIYDSLSPYALFGLIPASQVLSYYISYRFGRNKRYTYEIDFLTYCNTSGKDD